MNEDSKPQTDFMQLHKELGDLSKKVDKVLQALMGDEEIMHQGLISKVEQHERWIHGQKLFRAKVLGVALGSGTLGGVLIELLFKYLGI